MAAWETDSRQQVEVLTSSRGAITVDVDDSARYEGVTLRLSVRDAERLRDELTRALEGKTE